MIKVLIVDDEHLVRTGLITTIDWNIYGFDIVGEAEDGMDGFEKYLSLKPDILIVDVKMPILNGIELIEKITEQGNSECEFLLLSGYNDFVYVKRAMELGAKNYLLKPIKNQDLIDAMLKIKSSIEKNRKLKSDMISMDTKIEFLKNNFIFNLINGNIDKNDIESKFNFYEFHPSYANYFILHISSKRYNGNIFPDVSYYIPCFIDKNNYACIIFTESPSIPVDMLDAFSSANPDLEIGVSDICADLQEIPIIYRHALHAFERKYINNKNISYFLTGAHNKSDHFLVEKAIEIIKNQYANPISVKEVAEQLNISPSHLMHIFKNDQNKTFGTYLTEYRMEIAIQLIKLKKYKIYEICNMVGYKDIKYFRNTFKEYTGYSPTEYSAKKEGGL